MKNHMQPDVWLYRIVVAVLGLTVVGSVGGTIALGSATIRGMAGLFTPSPLNR